MEALKLKGVSKHGVLTIAVPQQFDEQELEVIILADNKKNAQIELADKNKKAHQEKIKRLMEVVGTAKYPDAPIDKYDVYDQ